MLHTTPSRSGSSRSASPAPAPLDGTRVLSLRPRNLVQYARDEWRCVFPPGTNVVTTMAGHAKRLRAQACMLKEPYAFSHNDFVWLDPAHYSDAQLRQHYARGTRLPGTRAGEVESSALADALGVRISWWQVGTVEKRREGHFFVRHGDERAPRELCIAVYGTQNAHFCALVPAGNGQWREVEAGGEGDCLFYAVGAALVAGGVDPATVTVPRLRAIAANHLQNDSSYDEGIRMAFIQALEESREPLPSAWWLRPFKRKDKSAP